MSELAARYDRAADSYDETRGGRERAAAVAEAILALAPGGGLVVDVAGGTGSVAAELAAAGRDVLVVDASHQMLRHAVRRLPGRAVRADARALPLADASVAVLSTIWLLHLLEPTAADAVIDEAARVLEPGGVLVTTVDKDLAHRAERRTDADAADRVAGRCVALGLEPCGSRQVHGDTDWHQTGVGWRVDAFAAGGRIGT